MAELQTGFDVSARRACEVVQLNRSTLTSPDHAPDQTLLRMRLRNLAAGRVRSGYRRLDVLLRREGWHINHKRVFHLYRLDGLNLRLKRTRKRVSQIRVVPPAATAPMECWSMDFMSDRLYDGRRFRILTLVDTVSRLSPTIDVDRSLTGERVVQVLERATAVYGLSQRISVDNGPEFISKALDAWAHRTGVHLDFSRPGTPTDNAFIESFNARLRDECLDQHWFASLEEARRIITAFHRDYKLERPHSALGNRTPTEFVRTWSPERAVHGVSG